MRLSYLFPVLWSVYLVFSVSVAAHAKPVHSVQGNQFAQFSTVEDKYANSIDSKPKGVHSTPIPTNILQLGLDQAIIPDWSRISFASLPPLSESSSLGAISWRAGQPVEQVLTLGDFQDSFHLQNLNFYAITLATQRDPQTVSLGQFKLLQHQTLADLVHAIPDLGKLPVSNVKPIASLLKSTKPDYQLNELTPLSIVIQDPELGTLSFNHFDLSPYNLSDVPGLSQTPFATFNNWQQAGIDDIPGLRSVPWSQFIAMPGRASLIGVVQLSKPAEPVVSSISGSDTDGYQTKCPDIQACPSITFTQNVLLKDKHWISGSAQRVKGGSGDLAAENLGLEPTGRNLYGSGFKVVLTHITPAAISSALYFHHCQRDSVLSSISCSPYAIGPVPFQSFQVGDPMLVGVVSQVAAMTQNAPLGVVTSEAIPVPTAANPPFWQTWVTALSHAFLKLEQML